MKKQIVAIAALCVSGCMSPQIPLREAPSAEYVLSGNPYTMIQQGRDQRKYADANHYCVEFPGEGRLSVTRASYNGNAIRISRVEYSKTLMANVVMSSIPAGRPPEVELSRLEEGEKSSAKAYDADYHQSLTETAFGKVIGLRINNVASAGSTGPFPLVRPLRVRSDGVVFSMSAHRLFVLDSDRFEIAVYTEAIPGGAVPSEEQMEKTVTELADKISASLMSCTVEMRGKSRR